MFIACLVHVLGSKAGHHLGWGKRNPQLLKFSKVVELIIA